MHTKTSPVTADDANPSRWYLALGFDLVTTKLLHGFGHVEHPFEMGLR